MDIQLSPTLDAFVTQGVRDGLFTSVEAAVEEGLELLAHRKRLKATFSVTTEEDLFNKLDAGLASLDAGKGIPALAAFASLRHSSR